MAGKTGDCVAKIIAVCSSKEKGTKKEPVAEVSLRKIMALLAMPMLTAVPIVR